MASLPLRFLNKKQNKPYLFAINEVATWQQQQILSTLPSPNHLTYFHSGFLKKDDSCNRTVYLSASVKPEGREQARCHTSPGNPGQHTAACVWGISSSKAEQPARLTWSLREEQARTRLQARTLRAVLLHARPYQRDTGELLASSGSGRWGRKGEVCSEVNHRSPKENQN